MGVVDGLEQKFIEFNQQQSFSMNTNDKIKPVGTTEEVVDDRRDAEIRIENKNVITAWLLIITELFYALMYGFFVQINEIKVTSSEDFVHTALLFILIVAGFGLVLSKSYQLVWSSLGFNLLITALSVQTYFLVNAFWTKATVYLKGTSFDSSSFPIYLTSNQLTTQTHTTLNQALKCSLSCIIAFSFIIGRAGLLEVYVVSTLGTVVYQLARQTTLNNFPYEVGTIKIFVYGGFLGLLMSLCLKKLGRGQANIIQHYRDATNHATKSLSLLGLLIIWALFPLLTRQVNILQNAATTQTSVFTVVLAMSSAGLMGQYMGYKEFGVNSLIYSVLGAGVAILSSSPYISNPVYAIAFGLASAHFQFLFMFLNRYLTNSFGPLDPHAFAFIGQGFLGIFYQVINRQIVQSNPDSLIFNWGIFRKSEYILGNGAITLGIALVLGFFIGTLFSCCAFHEQRDQFTDYTYWEQGDGISTVVKQEEQQKPEHEDVYVYEHNSKIKQKNSYL